MCTHPFASTTVEPPAIYRELIEPKIRDLLTRISRQYSFMPYASDNSATLPIIVHFSARLQGLRSETKSGTQAPRIVPKIRLLSSPDSADVGCEVRLEVDDVRLARRLLREM